jgi:hypothetical protein
MSESQQKNRNDQSTNEGSDDTKNHIRQDDPRSDEHSNPVNGGGSEAPHHHDIDTFPTVDAPDEEARKV